MSSHRMCRFTLLKLQVECPLLCRRRKPPYRCTRSPTTCTIPVARPKNFNQRINPFGGPKKHLEFDWKVDADSFDRTLASSRGLCVLELRTLEIGGIEYGLVLLQNVT